MTSLASLPLNELPDIAARVAAYRAGRDAFADLEATLDVVEAAGRPVWISTTPRQQAHACLARAKKRRDAGEVLPLFGIPFGVKDNIDVEGLETTAACPDFSYRPAASAFVVRQLVDAGAIPIGKTNLDQFATGLNGTRSPYGVPVCAFDENYVSGGSSSGSAVAVALGHVMFALGTDTAGSGRVPAGFNNIVGLKPSRGLLSTRGVVPACRTLDCVSILANTVADSIAVLAAAAIYDAEDPFARASRTALESVLPASFRFGVLTGETLAHCAPAVQARYRESIRALEGEGGTAVPFDFAPFEEAAALLYNGPWVAERLAAIHGFAETHADSMHPVVRDIVLAGRDYSAVDTFVAQYRLAELTRHAETLFQQIDLMLVPTVPFHPTIEEMLSDPVGANSRLGLFTNFVNLLDMAAIAVPAGWSDQRLPIGMTLIGPRFSDGMLAALADRLHRVDATATIGASATPLAATSQFAVRPSDKNVRLAVVGAHLSGQPLNSQLTDRGATFVATASTATGYSLYALPNTVPAKPGLARDGGAGGIEIELWDVPVAEFGSFVAAIPAPLGIGTVEIADGSTVKGFICEQYALAGAADITAFGGWRNFVQQRQPVATPAIA